MAGEQKIHAGLSIRKELCHVILHFFFNNAAASAMSPGLRLQSLLLVTTAMDIEISGKDSSVP